MELSNNKVHTMPTPVSEMTSLSGPIENMKINIERKKKIIFVKIS